LSEERIIKALLRKWWLILLVTFIITGLSAVYFKYSVKPIYESNTTMYIMARDSIQGNYSNSDTITTDNIIVSQQLLKDYGEILKSDTVTSAVWERLGNKSETSSVRISMVNDTNLLSLSVDDPNPAKAQDVANVYSQVFIEKIVGITNQNNITIVDTAKLPTKPIEQKTTKKLLTVALSSFLAICGLILLLEFLDNTARTVDDIENELGYNVIGIIPEMDIK